jgi:hypothetical protein
MQLDPQNGTKLSVPAADSAGIMGFTVAKVYLKGYGLQYLLQAHTSSVERIFMSSPSAALMPQCDDVLF